MLKYEGKIKPPQERYKNMLKNYHTHTFRCHHASGTDEEMVLAAIEVGIKTLGFSDHGPLPYKDFVSGMRMTVEESKDYFKSVRTLKEKYKDQIEIKIGFEYEYFPEFIPFLKQFKEENQIDYYILGHHFVPDEITGVHTCDITEKKDVLLYKENVIDGINSGLFRYVAHPDMFMQNYKEFDETAKKASADICLAAKRKNIPLEYNIYGIRKSALAGRELYPVENFWHIAGEVGNSVILGIDAHNPEHITGSKYIIQAEENVKRLGLKLQTELDF